jgi:hypothetical protein
MRRFVIDLRQYDGSSMTKAVRSTPLAALREGLRAICH